MTSRAPDRLVLWRRVRVGEGRGARSRREVNIERDARALDGGFTLFEMLIVLVILPMVIGALAYGLVSVFSLQGSVSGRVTDSGNAQTVSATFIKDVQSAGMITVSATPACGTGTQLIGLKWSGSASTYLSYVSYVAVPNDGSTTYSLVRQYCAPGPSSAPTATTTLATDLSAQSAVTSPTITCAPAASGCASTALSAWISAAQTSRVTLTVGETQSVIAGTSTPFSFALSATPRIFSETANPAPPSSFAPFTVLNTSSCNALTLGNNAALSINVGTGTGNGSLGVASTCAGAVSVGPNAQLVATSVVTADTSLNSVTAGSGATYPSSEYYSGQVGNPFALLTPPADPSSGGSNVSCTLSGSTYTCPPGNYTTNPGLNFVNNATVNFTPGGTFSFQQGLTLANNVVANFDTGTYIFDGTTSALSTAPGITINATSGALFYIHTGSVTFANNSSVNISGLPQYDGVAIWDVAAVGTTNPLTLGNNGAAEYGYGGIYVPNGQVIINNNGTLTVGFMVVSTASISNNVNVNISSATASLSNG